MRRFEKDGLAYLQFGGIQEKLFLKKPRPPAEQETRLISKEDH
jgi:hypothetical protein